MPSPEQLRANAIISFREEVSRLAEQGIAFDPTTLTQIRRYHDQILTALGQRDDVDVGTRAAQLSLGMRIATLLGTIAFSSAYALFVSAHWGGLGLPLQIALVSLPPLMLVGFTHLAAQRDPSGYVASLLATVAVIAFAVNLSTVGALFNLPDSRQVFLVVGTFALLLAYRYQIVLPLLPGIAGIGGWCWSLGAIPFGLWWRDGFSFLEPLIVVGLGAMIVPTVTRGPERFNGWWRGAGAAAITLALLMLGESARFSLLQSLNPNRVEAGYLILGGVALPGMVAWGIAKNQRLVMQVATVGAVWFLALRLVDWFWDLVPQWAFFLIAGSFALAALFVLRRLHRRMVAR